MNAQYMLSEKCKRLTRRFQQAMDPSQVCFSDIDGTLVHYTPEPEVGDAQHVVASKV
jgi:hypothetical protein